LPEKAKRVLIKLKMASNIEQKIQSVKENGIGYLYCWHHDKTWSFGLEKKKRILPYLDGSDLDIERIEPISRLRAFLLGIPWIHVADVSIVESSKVDKMQKKIRGRNIFFHTPLPKRYEEAYRIFENPFVIWNRIRGDENRTYSGPYLTIVGEYRYTEPLAEALFQGEKECSRCISGLFNIPEDVSRNYKNQKTLELYDPTRHPKLSIKILKS
jgi:hypothetical protein